MTITNKSIVKRPTVLVAIIASIWMNSVASADHGVSHAGSQTRAMKKVKKIGLEGHCPVCVIEARKWERGRPEFQTTYDGVTYYFPNAQIKEKFDATPAKYVPALGGDCTVCLAKMNKRVPGNIRHASIRNNRLFLFPGAGEKKMFLADAAAFSKVDLAANGECIVCLAKMNKHVPGKPEHTVIHNGLRYQFPSAREAAMFSQQPGEFVSVVSGDASSARQTSMRKANTTTKLVKVSGTSACAGCEFGVKPIASPDELGLAVKTQNGRVIVVENAHKLYPKIYADRFDGQKLHVEGEIVKTSGKVAWLEPSLVRVLN